MKILLIIITFVLTLNTTNAQLQGQAKIDSLLKELPKIKEDTNGVNFLKELSFEYHFINPDKGIDYGLKGLKLSLELGWEIGKAKCYNSLGSNYDGGKLDYLKALEYYLKALKINEKLGNKRGIANNLGNIGNQYASQSNYPKALEYYLKALKINEELVNKRGIALALGNIGLIYSKLSNYPKALEYYLKALKINEKLGNKRGIAPALGSIGNVYYSLSDYSNCLMYFQKALEIFEELGDKYRIAIGLGNVGELHFALAQDSIIKNSENKMELLLNKEVNLIKAIENSKRAIDLSSEIGELHQQSYFLNNLSEAYQLKGDYKKAFETYKEYKSLNDSIFSSENNTKIANLEAKRENELKEKEIVILKKEKENQKLQRYAMFGGIAGLGIIIGLILIQRRKSEKLLLNVLPAKIAKRLKAKEHPIADHFDNASIIFIDLVGFTKMSSNANPKEIVALLNDIFTLFDKLADKHGLEKIKTIGDAYMAVAGIPEIQTDHAKRTALMALDIKSEMKDFKTSDGTEIHFRIGIDCGAVVAGVIGEKKFIYDLWSDAVNTASRMESTGESGQIQITENFKSELEKFEGNWNFTLRGEFEIKGKGLMKTYFLD